MQPPTASQPTRPPSSSRAGDKGRIIALDVCRGIAVAGIALMNVYVFALPAQSYYNPAALGPPDALDRLIWLASFVFIEDKFRTLFAMLFGAGCLILLEKSAERPMRAHFARMAVLFAIGLVHSILLASNDVLRSYAIAGLALPLLAPLSARALIAIAIGLLTIHVAGGLVTFGGAMLDFAKGRLTSDAIVFMERNFGSDAGGIEFTLERGREGLFERVERRVLGIPGQLSALAASVPINLSAMALGMGLWRAGLLRGAWRTFTLQRLASLCALGALPPLCLLAALSVRADYAAAIVAPAALILSAPFDMLLALCYTALIMAFARGGGPITRALAAAGRLSLTNYLLTSCIFAALFASWGLGLFAQVSRSGAFALAFVPVAIMLAVSPLWLARFGQGPAERLWRRLAKAAA